MKQTNMMRWIEAAEARSVCLLAEEDPVRAKVPSRAPNASSITVLAKLREQLYLGEASRRLARVYRGRLAA